MKSDPKVRLSDAMQAEEAQRSERFKNHPFECVPWRGAGGDIGACVYCGKKPDAITSYYTDRARSGLASRAQ